VLVAFPVAAAWRHVDARDGFETAFFARRGSDLVMEGHTAAVEAGEAWAVRYAVTIDARWHAHTATVVGQTARGAREVVLESVDDGRWQVDGTHRPGLDGCFDVDLESSACTNTLPLRRLGLQVGQRAAAPAVYVRAADLSVMRLEQDYRRLHSVGALQRYWYRSPAFDFECELVFDAAGLTVEYPGVAHRVL
jgi:uncharacterized protein